MQECEETGMRGAGASLAAPAFAGKRRTARRAAAGFTVRSAE
ncbi:hypothetical protein BURPS305_2678 [Burkholderia pseudomallei 305]|uniref:Uncharacterized protein n=1 Tax=Burkholderia pseudomallei 1710a TaxID=320371 RepID=A0A0E1WIS1_BURPE|nr:hypothetical protein BURPS668_1205 [Burkholderia pseudomallei 668]EBA47433.1 hypothetical protein BURPS305_2678 [Burkholderia pseudomallei 305]EDO93966.1 hypothetical protein BURPSPAST_A0967 [Burkholderia pseudomallei Pasteur 52237]EEC36715.1 hypothetical protein BUC_1421 [Burkholderia pseudomallei 576]EEH28587.1 hypothetical protein BUH_1126 [Burkholderia pseudomallei Pakistan 9]EET09522.1 hypothetical protein BURPS1710A_1528 [Burkholderia pseudomallei 1710a]